MITIEERRKRNRERMRRVRNSDKDYVAKERNYYRKWYKENGRNRAEDYRDIIDEWKLNHPKEEEAHRILSREVRSGRMIKPERCEMCKRKCRLSGHHDDYDRPLNVRWLCSSCHKIIHGNKSLTDNS